MDFDIGNGYLENSIVKLNNDIYMEKSQTCGTGKYGVVYKGYQLSSNRIIAIKFISRKILKLWNNYQREVKILE
jgi:serine/threonine protein kinase